MSDFVLSAKQSLALASLLSGSNHVAAAEAAGVTPRQVGRWLVQDDFRAALRAGQAELLRQAGRRLLSETSKSIEVLAEVRDDPEAGPSPRVRAAGKLLDTAFTSYEVLEIEHRIAALEEMNDAT